MAYTLAPEKQTYDTQRIPMASDFMLRPGNNMNYALAETWGQDAGMVNALPVKVEGQEQIGSVTRPGLTGVSMANGVVRGLYVWEKSSIAIYYFLVVGVNVWSCVNDPFNVFNWSVANTLLTNATTPVRFAEFINDVNVKSLVLVDGVEGYVYTSNSPGTKITDVDFPTPHVPWPVFLNGRLYLAKDSTGDIYNSDLNDPAVWTAGNFISTEIYPDDVRALLKVENYVLAVGTQGSEYFYDAGNATGTPLARSEGTVLPFGTLFPNSIAVNKDMVMLLANTNEGQSCFKVVTGFQHRTVDATSVYTAYTGRLDNPYNDFRTVAASCRGYFFRHLGLLYYGFHTDGVRLGQYQTPSIAACFAYSFDAKAWTELQHGSDATSRESRYAFPVYFTGPSTSAGAVTFCGGTVGASADAFFAKMDDASAQDSITNYTITPIKIYEEWRTGNLSFGTMNLKSCHRLGLDVQVGFSQEAATADFNIQWNDYDYNFFLWTTARTITVDNTGNTTIFPFITQLGSFRRRAFRVYTNAGKIIRSGGLEVDINKGQQ